MANGSAVYLCALIYRNMSKNKKAEEQEAEMVVNVEEVYDRTEHFVNENQNTILAIVGGIVLVIGGYFAYDRFYMQPLQEEASAAMFMAEHYFADDSLETALNGDGQYLGFLSVIEDYSRTDAGNLAQYYAGISYLRLGKFNEAIEHLEKFDSDDQILAPMALGAIGDAYSELGDNDKAIEFYVKASEREDNNFTTPVYLFKAGFTAEQAGKTEDAVRHFTRLKEDFAETNEGREAEKYLARATAKAN